MALQQQLRIDKVQQVGQAPSQLAWLLG